MTTKYKFALEFRRATIMNALIRDYCDYTNFCWHALNTPTSNSCLQSSRALLPILKSLICCDNDVDELFEYYTQRKEHVHLRHWGFVCYLTMCEVKTNRWDCSVELSPGA